MLVDQPYDSQGGSGQHLLAADVRSVGDCRPQTRRPIKVSNLLHSFRTAWQRLDYVEIRPVLGGGIIDNFDLVESTGTAAQLRKRTVESCCGDVAACKAAFKPRWFFRIVSDSDCLQHHFSHPTLVPLAMVPDEAPVVARQNDRTRSKQNRRDMKECCHG